MSFLRRVSSWLLPPAAVPGAPVQEIFTGLPVLETERLMLRKARPGDAAAIFRYASDPEVARYVLWDAHESLSDSRAYVRYLRHQYASGEPSSWVIVHREEGSVIGTMGYMSYDAEHGLAEIGYSLSREMWGKGLATEALSRVVRFSFDTLSLHRLEGMYDTANPASRRVMEKSGMRFEGVLRGRVWNKGSYRDVGLCAITREDYEDGWPRF